MRTFQEFITEGRDAPLYHGTTLYNAAAALDIDKLQTNTSDGDHRNSISLTRNFDFAKHWAMVNCGVFRSATVLVLSQTKLAQTHRIFPHNYWADPHSLTYGAKSSPTRLTSVNTYGINSEPKANEFEEYLVKDIKPLSKYLTKIIIFGDPKKIWHTHRTVPNVVDLMTLAKYRHLLEYR